MARPAQTYLVRADMPLDDNFKPKKDGLASRATAVGPRPCDLSQQRIEDTQNPPIGNTGGSSRQSVKNKENTRAEKGNSESLLPQSPPPSRKSRESVTSAEMFAFRERWFFDWLTVTVPNGSDGKGTRSDGPTGVREVREAERRLCTWGTTNGLHRMRIGKGSDGYAVGMRMARDPLADEPLASIRSGHATNMPGLELSGGDGACAELAPAALSGIGPVLLARADVSLDVSQEGLMDDLEQYARDQSALTRMEPPVVTVSKSGRSWRWGSGEASVVVYQKDFERVSDGKLDAAVADANLTRIEFRLRPHKSPKKAGMARVARDEGAGALLGTTLWVRRMASYIAEVTGAASDSTFGITRVENKPDPRTVRDSANHGMEQYAKTFCRAAAADIVERDFDGNWLAAEIDPSDIVDDVIKWVSGSLRDASQTVVTDLGLDEVRCINEEAARLHDDLGEWMARQEQETEDAQEYLEASLARVLAGAPAIVPDNVFSGVAA